jgi:YHS domain-containing protein
MRVRTFGLATLAFLFFSVPAWCKTTANVRDGIILQGYDPVSYFTQSAPLKGDPRFRFEKDGITYLFANEANKLLFTKTPGKYAPAYEGWCATAVGKGIKYAIDPLNYKITDGRLFLFYRETGLFGGDAKPEWVKNEPESIRKADANWPKVQTLKE